MVGPQQNMQSGTWQGIVFIKDVAKDKNYTLKFKTISEKPSKLRLDVTSSLIGHIASFSVMDQTLQYIIPSEKSYFSGPVASQQMKKMLPFEFSPKILMNAFWNQSLTDGDWLCSKDKTKQRKCMSKKMGLKMSWAKVEGVPYVSLLHKRGLVRFKIKSFKAGLSAQEKNRFKIKNPGW